MTDTDETIREQLEVFRSSNEPEVVWSEEDRSQFAKIMKEQGIESQRMKEALELFYYRFISARVVNAVCPFYTNIRIPREQIYQRAIANGLDAKIHPKFTGVSVRYSHQVDGMDLKFTAIYFSSGAINCVGVKCLKSSGIGIVEQIIKKNIPTIFGKALSEDVTILKKISNRVISLKVPQTISLDKLEVFNKSEEYWRHCKYQLDIFPGLIYIIPKMKAKVLYFRTGSMISCGVTSSHLQKAVGMKLVKKLAYYVRTALVEEDRDPV